MKRTVELFAILFALILCLPVTLKAQGENAYGSFSPFSVFGIGDISSQGTAYNKMMGGVGIASRDVRYINYLNPAALSARDSLSFMADFGLEQKNSYFRGPGAGGNMVNSVANTFNMYDFVMSFPIWKSSAFAVGITPYSDLGYVFKSDETNDDILADIGDVIYSNYGEGSIYSAFVSAGVTFWKRLSVGAEFTYYFGNLERHSTAKPVSGGYRSIDSGTKYFMTGVSGKFGLQYEQPFGNGYSLTAGATYRLAPQMKAEKTRFAYAGISSVIDTVYSNTTVHGIRFSDEIGVGLSFRKADKWAIEFNYTRSDWTSTGIDGISLISDDRFSPGVSNSYRLGFEIIPNRYDVRYYMRRISYRGGVYYRDSYFTVDSNPVGEIGFTLGMTLPVFRFYNGINLGIDFGQRGGFSGVDMRERYFKFVIGFSLHDIWFQRPKYK